VHLLGASPARQRLDLLLSCARLLLKYKIPSPGSFLSVYSLAVPEKGASDLIYVSTGRSLLSPYSPLVAEMDGRNVSLPRIFLDFRSYSFLVS